MGTMAVAALGSKHCKCDKHDLIAQPARVPGRDYERVQGGICWRKFLQQLAARGQDAPRLPASGIC